jgi:hypothetical protein
MDAGTREGQTGGGQLVSLLINAIWFLSIT